MSTGTIETGISVLRDVRIPTADGAATLSADVFLPANGEPAPAVLTVWPYRKDTGIAEPAMRWFAERGYATVLVDARGTGSSDGDRRPPFDPNEVDDAVVAIDWAATQDWCDGAVGMWGHSYGAIMALRAASRRPAALRAIVPFQCVIDPELDLWHPQGAPGAMTLAAWGAMTLCQQLMPPLRDDSSAEDEQRWRRRLDDPEPWIVDLFKNGPGAPVWRDRAIDPSAITTPALCVGGWRDLMCDGTIRAYEAIAGPKKLVMGPWSHTIPEMSPVEPIEFLSLVLRWWDRWLRGIDNGVMDQPNVIGFAQGEGGGWRTFDAWPPPAGTVELIAGAAGKYDPDPTTGALGPWSLGNPGLCPDEREDDARGLCITSEPLDRELVIAGRPQVSVRLAAMSGSSARIVVRLADVDPDGRSTFISSGTLARARAGVTERVVLWPTMYRVAPEHRVRVVLGDADFPRVWPRVWPAGPRVLDFEQIDVAIPVSPGDPVAPPAAAVEPPPHDVVQLLANRWNVTRDGDLLNVNVRESAAAPTSSGHVVELNQQVMATVSRETPALARIRATDGAVVRTPSGKVFEVRVVAEVTAHTLTVHADITEDGDPIYDREWTTTGDARSAAGGRR